MKKVIVLLLVALTLLSCTVPALAVSDMKEYKHKGFTIEIPEAMIQDTEWAKKNKYADAWYDKDMNYEIILFEDFVMEDAMPLLLDYDPEDDWNICRRYSSQEFAESVAFSHGRETVVINDAYADYYYMEIYWDAEKQADHFFYQFNAGLKTYNLMFFVYNKDYINTAKEIAGTVKTKEIFEFLLSEELWIGGLLIVALSAIVIIVRRRKKA